MKLILLPFLASISICHVNAAKKPHFLRNSFAVTDAPHNSVVLAERSEREGPINFARIPTSDTHTSQTPPCTNTAKCSWDCLWDCNSCLSEGCACSFSSSSCGKDLSCEAKDMKWYDLGENTVLSGWFYNKPRYCMSSSLLQQVEDAAVVILVVAVSVATLGVADEAAALGSTQLAVIDATAEAEAATEGVATATEAAETAGETTEAAEAEEAKAEAELNKAKAKEADVKAKEGKQAKAKKDKKEKEEEEDDDDDDEAECDTTLEESISGQTFTKQDDGYQYSAAFNETGSELYIFEQKSDSDSYLVGTLTAFEGYTAKFENGDYCDVLSAPRSGSVEFVEDCAATEVAVTSVSEISTCVYKMVVSGVCPCGPSQAPTLEELVEKLAEKKEKASKAAKAEVALKNKLKKAKQVANPDWETPSIVKLADGSSLPSIGKY